MAPGLKTYRSKRRFGVTSEPRGKAIRHNGHAFVIQKHAATRLHYDLRLELDGVMKSWAVTRGPSLDPHDKRLAVEVEDHPIEYNKFEGTIPKGEYGGGTVMIWDRGTWEPDHDPHKGFEKGHLDFHLHGEKLTGGWHLVRMRRRPGEKRNNWLLIKAHDDAARSGHGEAILDLDRSATTGRTLDEIAEGAPKRKTAEKKKAAKTPGKAVAGTAKSKPVRRKAAALTSKRAVRRSTPNSKGVTRLPGFIDPCLATLSDKALDSDNWIHELKFDGYRLQAHIDHGRVKLLTRKGLNWTTKFKTIAEALAKLPCATAIVDGELVVEGPDGISSFSLLQQALKAGDDGKMIYYAFDLLHLDGADLSKKPLDARKAALKKLLGRNGKTGPIRYSESIEGKGTAIHASACRMGLEGIVSKLRDAPYRSGRGTDWLKTKCSDRQELVIGGYTTSTADARSVGALALGYYENGDFVYAGRTGTGFTHAFARELYRKLKAIERRTPPFAAVTSEERGKNGATWVEPTLVAEVDFHGWTHDGRVRQASFQGLREDKKAKDVVRERKQAVVAARTSTAAKRGPAPARTAKKKDAVISGVHLTHPDRVYWDDAGVTKEALARYYEAIWPWMRPHVVDRVIAIVRCPEGASGQCFFQKHATAGIDPKFLNMVREPDGDQAIAIKNLDGLIALAQGGALEIHVRGSTVDRLEEANRVVFDLDPGPGVTWPALLEAAREVRDRLSDIGLESFVKTTGGKGLHVVLPVLFAPWQDVKDFAHALAGAMEADSPGKFISSATKAKRDNRVFVDYLRNSREATAIAPYSTRARAGAPVAVPLTWTELSKLPASNHYTVLNIAQRLGRLRKDPWADIGKIKQHLPNARRKR
ncbi:MAG: ATP-dependent DNA ligase clustered with Ku protein, LigD [Pseudolabrys sp.]|jgi:bifunctional non-homologous end joining protein LigD|nr:ATP-dependent DNA ligase clustered with Ku protein, LigD [Pseudolabrys sp.]